MQWGPGEHPNLPPWFPQLNWPFFRAGVLAQLEEKTDRDHKIRRAEATSTGSECLDSSWSPLTSAKSRLIASVLEGGLAALY